MKINKVKSLCAVSFLVSAVGGVMPTYKAQAQAQPPAASMGATTDRPGSTSGTTPPTTSGTLDSAGASQGANMVGQIGSVLTGGLMITQAVQHFQRCPKSNPDCAMGALKAGMAILSFMQAGAHGSSAGSAGATAAATDGYGYTGTTYGSNDSNYRTDTGDAATDNAVKSAIAKLQSGVAGSVVDLKKGTIKTADGKTFKAKDFASPAAMAAAGFPPGAVSGAMAYASDMEKQALAKMEKLKLGALTAANGFDEGGGGAARSLASGTTEDGAGYAGAGTGAGASDLNPDATNMAGMQKNYNGEPIGVAADSIFLMMNRRYKVKESQESFFSDAELALQK